MVVDSHDDASLMTTDCVCARVVSACLCAASRSQQQPNQMMNKNHPDYSRFKGYEPGMAAAARQRTQLHLLSDHALTMTLRLDI